MTTSERWQTLSKSIDAAIAGLTVFDAEGLEALEHQIRAVTAEYLAHGLADGQEHLPELLRKHSLLQAVLNATAANLKVMDTVLKARTNAYDGRNDFNGYLDRTAEPIEKRSAQ